MAGAGEAKHQVAGGLSAGPDGNSRLASADLGQVLGKISDGLKVKGLRISGLGSSCGLPFWQ